MNSKIIAIMTLMFLIALPLARGQILEQFFQQQPQEVPQDDPIEDWLWTRGFLETTPLSAIDVDNGTFNNLYVTGTLFVHNTTSINDTVINTTTIDLTNIIMNDALGQLAIFSNGGTISNALYFYDADSPTNSYVWLYNQADKSMNLQGSAFITTPFIRFQNMNAQFDGETNNKNISISDGSSGNASYVTYTSNVEHYLRFWDSANKFIMNAGLDLPNATIHKNISVGIDTDAQYYLELYGKDGASFQQRGGGLVMYNNGTNGKPAYMFLDNGYQISFSRNSQTISQQSAIQSDFLFDLDDRTLIFGGIGISGNKQQYEAATGSVFNTSNSTFYYVGVTTDTDFWTGVDENHDTIDNDRFGFGSLIQAGGLANQPYSRNDNRTAGTYDYVGNWWLNNSLTLGNTSISPTGYIVEGYMYYNQTLHTVCLWNSTDWVRMDWGGFCL